jgi:methyltransferase (TIGR00027 family)
VRPGRPSRTAYGAAIYRAVHQDVDGGRIFTDPLAWQILGLDRHATVARIRADGRHWLRWFIAARHRFAEDALAAAYGRGTRQVVVLGAGLDTFAARNPHPGLRVFEVDFPATGAWKAERLAEAGIAPGAGTVFVGCDFEQDDLLVRLVSAEFDTAAPAFFLWLGVVPYLTAEAVAATLAVLGGLPDAEVVFDYPSPLRGQGLRAVLARRWLARRVAAAGEPLQGSYPPAEMAALLRRCGFGEIEDLGGPELNVRYFDRPADARGGGAHLVRARVLAP